MSDIPFCQADDPQQTEIQQKRFNTVKPVKRLVGGDYFVLRGDIQ